jgi:hypothetical protein
MLAIESPPPGLRFEPDSTLVPRERRHGGRVQSTGTAIVHGPFAARGRIIDLAIGGLRLLVDDAAAVPDVGAPVRLDVRLDGLGRWLRVVGSVVRVDVRGSAVALVIELLVVPPEFEDLVQDELLSALELVGQRRRRHGARCISVDRTPDLAMQIDRMVGIREQLGGMV